MSENKGGMPPEDDEDEYDQIEKLPDLAVSRDFNHAEPELVASFKKLKAAYEKRYPGRVLICTCTYRSVKEQKRLYAQGRYGNNGSIVTWCDGVIKKSKHNYFPSRAIDVAVLDGGKLTWDEAEYWPFGAVIKSEKLKLIWGGDFKKPDYPHIELGD